jgi:ribosomal protein L11 methyltransferase
MPYLQLSTPCSAAEYPCFERALENVGALAVTLQDAHLDQADEQAIFEPEVGALPLWQEMILTALFDADRDPLLLLAALEASDPALDWTQARWQWIEDRVWERAWLDAFQPMRFGRRLWIQPWTIESTVSDPAAVVVRLDPGLAFGTGTHPTTALCLEWLDTIDLAGRAVIDYGCGSGVLAIAALALGARRVVGVDHDPQALAASRANAERNRVAERLDLYRPEQLPSLAVDCLVANILAAPLLQLAERFASLVLPGGVIALSGILAEQRAELAAHYATWFADLTVAEREGWVRLTGRRRVPA